MGFNPILVDFDRQRADQSQRALLVGKDADDLGAALNLLIKPLEHVGALKVLVMLSGQPIKGQRFLDVFFHPATEPRTLFLPPKQPSRQIPAGFLGIAPIVEPA